MQYEIKFKISKTIPTWEFDTDDKELAEKYAHARSLEWFESLAPSDIDISIEEVNNG